MPLTKQTNKQLIESETNYKDQSDYHIRMVNAYGKNYTSKDIDPILLKEKTKSPTKKEVKKLIKDVEAEVIAPKIKTDNIDELIKLIEGKLLLFNNSFINYKY